jgi:prepilin-type N-terminal cleavage/methylation domain-containing protein
MAELATRWKGPKGFSLAEMLVVVALIAIGAAVAIPVTMQMVNRAKGDSALVVVHTVLDTGRNRAVAERRNVELTFVAPNRIRLERIEVPGGGRTVVGEMQLEAGQEFVKDPDLPDTPDAFGAGAAISFTGVSPVMFTSDGSLIDSAGDITNGTVFVAKPGHPETARAVTVFGVTGMLRSWKWRGAQWFQ